MSNRQMVLPLVVDVLQEVVKVKRRKRQKVSAGQKVVCFGKGKKGASLVEMLVVLVVVCVVMGITVQSGVGALQHAKKMTAEIVSKQNGEMMEASAEDFELDG